MDALWVRKGVALVPADPVTREMLDQIPEGHFVTTDEPRRRRSPQHHRFMMRILQKVVENTDAFADIDDLMFELKVRCGMFKEIRTNRGTRLIPRSISFAAMSQQQFKRVADRWLEIISTEIMPGVDVETWIREAGD
jgi:hypothetical protein